MFSKRAKIREVLIIVTPEISPADDFDFLVGKQRSRKIYMTASHTVKNETQETAANYSHYGKFIEPGESIELSNSTLKWHNLAKKDEPVPGDIYELARGFLEKESGAGNLSELGELGFIILHRCGHDFYFLLVSSWRNDNELWESVFAKNGAAQTDFEPFTFAGLHRGTFCVWELAAVWHEQQAWRRYLLSAKDNAAKCDYLQDQYRGEA